MNILHGRAYLSVKVSEFCWQSPANMGNACQCCASSHDEPSPSSSLSIDSLKLSIQQVHPTDQIEPLIGLIEYQLQRIKASAEASPSSSSIFDVTSNISLAADLVNIISTEAEKLKSMDMVKEMESLALSGLKVLEETHLLFLGLSVAAHALERCVTMKSDDKDCIDLLQAIAFLAKDLKQFKEAMPGESERLSQAVQMIVEGAIMCCDYINKGGVSRFGTLILRIC